MASLKPDDFVAKFQGGGYRTNLYEAQFLGGQWGSDKTTFLCKSASAPPSTMGIPDVSFMGRKVKLSGDREYPAWETTFYEDSIDLLREVFDKYHEDKLNSAELNTQNGSALADYSGSIRFALLDRAGTPIRTYEFFGAWPSTIGEISVGYDQQDTVGEFSVTWEYQYWKVVPNQT